MAGRRAAIAHPIDTDDGAVPAAIRRFLRNRLMEFIGFLCFALCVAVGVALGLLAAAASTRALQSLLFGIGALDPMTFVGVAGAMILVGLLAAWVPARRASRVDPVEAIRGE